MFDAGSTQVTKTRQNLNSSLSVPWCPRVLVVKCFSLYAVRCTHENTETREHVKTLTQVLVYLSALRVLVVKCFSLYAVRYLHENTSLLYLGLGDSLEAQPIFGCICKQKRIIMHSYKLSYVLFTFFLVHTTIWAQEYYEEPNYAEEAFNLSEDVRRNAEFYIPSAPAFYLMGVTPDQVGRPGSVQDFKVDWRVKNYVLAPDLAIEAQPFWAFYYDRKGLDAYREASPFMKTLSTLSLSLGTAKMDGLNHLSYAAKISLFREHDPVDDPVLLDSMARTLKEMEWPYRQMIDSLQSMIDTLSDRQWKLELKEQVFNLKSEVKNMHHAQKQRLIEMEAAYLYNHWNSSGLDLAVGRVYTYNNDFDTLNFQKAGFGIWVNGAYRLGYRGLLSGVARLKQIGDNRDVMLGGSYRFGSHKFNFFGELVYEALENYSTNGFSPEELFASKFAPDLDNGWYQYQEGLQAISRWTLTWGGDFRLSSGILLNFAIRTKLDEKFRFMKLIPVANVTCLMR